MGIVEFHELPVSEIEALRPLWEKLNAHHLSRSSHFRAHYESFTFEKRIKKFLLDDIDVRIDIARTGVAIVGYCISTIDRRGHGEIDSLYIEEAFRRSGTGDGLLRRALGWLKGEGAEEITIVVAAGNEEAFSFYRRHGFYPAYTTLKLVT